MSMLFHGPHNEVFRIETFSDHNSTQFAGELKSGYSIVWNIGKPAVFKIDKQQIPLPKNCVLFLTSNHSITDYTFSKLWNIRFNRDFYCAVEDDQEIGCKGLLFYGNIRTPKITIPQNELKNFSYIWQTFEMEMGFRDRYQLDMLRTNLRRFLLSCIRIYRKENFDIEAEDKNVTLIREFNFLVEQHYKTLTTVKDYASLLYRSPKTIANVFKKCIDKSPLQLINDRRLSEAKRLLLYTDEPVSRIAEMLSFNDIQAFSNFFKRKSGQSPMKFRKSS